MSRTATPRVDTGLVEKDTENLPMVLRANRIAVLGPTGAGKSTLARQLANLTTLPIIELDAFNWNSEWQRVDPDTFRSLVAKAVQSERWITDGHYPQVGDLVWNRAEVMVWLDYGLVSILPRLMRRQAKTLVKKERLWNGNTSRGWEQFLPKTFITLLQTRIDRIRRCMREQRELDSIIDQFNNLQVIRLKSPKEAERWLMSLTNMAPFSALIGLLVF